VREPLEDLGWEVVKEDNHADLVFTNVAKDEIDDYLVAELKENRQEIKQGVGQALAQLLTLIQEGKNECAGFIFVNEEIPHRKKFWNRLFWTFSLPMILSDDVKELRQFKYARDLIRINKSKWQK